MDDQYQALSQEMFHLLHTMKRTSMAKMKSQHGLHHGQGHLLGVLMNEDNLPQRELATRLNIRPASLTDLVEKMEREQLVSRERDKADRRIVRVVITDKGRALVQQNIKTRREVEETMFGVLSADEVATMTRVFHKMAASLATNLDQSRKPGTKS